MSNLKKIAGFDVSKFFFDVSVIADNHEQSRRFNYDSKGLTALVKWLPEGCSCVMEATGPYYLKLAICLHSHGFAVSVVNPLVIKRFSQMRLLRAKTDKADAKMIAAYGITEELSAWKPPADYIVKLKQLEALLHLLEKQHSALLCQMEAFTASSIMDKDVKQFLQKAITDLELRIAQITKKMDAIVRQYHEQEYNSLLSIPGLGRKTAVLLIALTDCFKKFKNYRQVSAYLGTCPRIVESGISVKGKARICKMGMSRIRAMLYLCAWSAKRCNKACKELYDRLVLKGKSKRLALIAVVNKLIKQAFAIVTSNSTYKQDYQKNICF